MDSFYYSCLGSGGACSFSQPLQAITFFLLGRGKQVMVTPYNLMAKFDLDQLKSH